MARDRTIEVEGIVVECRANTTVQVKLGNGHIVLAHLSPDEKPASIHLLRGDKVMLEMTPYDMSKGRIISRQH